MLKIFLPLYYNTTSFEVGSQVPNSECGRLIMACLLKEHAASFPGGKAERSSCAAVDTPTTTGKGTFTQSCHPV